MCHFPKLKVNLLNVFDTFSSTTTEQQAYNYDKRLAAKPTFLFPALIRTTRLLKFNSALSNYASVPANNNLKSRLRARKYSKCMKTWHEASTSGYCSRELKCKSKVVC